MNWQSIETAPKDGSKILAFEYYWVENPFVCYWYKSRWVVHCPGTSLVEMNPDYWLSRARAMNPDYWMPLPEPPTEDEI
jgi:hypothetical protein